jgi:hypothetical protein
MLMCAWLAITFRNDTIARRQHTGVAKALSASNSTQPAQCSELKAGAAHDSTLLVHSAHHKHESAAVVAKMCQTIML